ncbi:alpha/beta-hydrolase [Panus rudis PR-1116 ss-1]|nr:alpha/beta-hydrolase [Panus rudis PR-1116 ss-1]
MASSTASRPRTKEILDPSYPLLVANRATIDAIERRTFSYGPTDVHKLDVYYPPSQTTPSNADERRPPILVFFYGGSMVRGARTSPPSYLVHNNLGAFFAHRGILTVIADYRSQDVLDAVKWVIGNVNEGDFNNVFILAHSAGGIHLAGVLLTPSFFSEVAHAVRGVIFMGVPFRISPDRREFYAIALQCYGDKKRVNEHQPIGLLKSADKEYISSLPPVRNLRAASEPRPIAKAIQEFTDEFEDKGGHIEEFVLSGHTHLSPVLALCSGSGEEWGEEVAAWIFDKSAKKDIVVHVTD